jgi:HSP20 family protein
MLQLRSTTTRPVTLFESLLDNLFMFPMELPETRQPVYDIVENENEFIVDFHLAGVKKEDVTITTEKDELSIKAERKEVKDLKYNRKESYYGVYEKTFSLPNTVDKDNINASFADGVLTLKIPKLKVAPKLSKSQILIN